MSQAVESSSRDAPHAATFAPTGHMNEASGSILALDGDRFLVAAYQAALGREPDPGGLVNYLNRLSAGESKHEILSELRASPEGRAFAARNRGSAPGAAVARSVTRAVHDAPRLDFKIEAQGRHASERFALGRVSGMSDVTDQRDGSPAAQRQTFGRMVQIDDLLACDGPEFLGRAYLAVLGRQIDPDGFRTYDARLRSGASKLSIVAELHDSAEGRSHGALIPALAARLARESPVQGDSSIRARDLLRLEGIRFVDAAYRAIVGTPPSQEARARFATCLFTGTGKLETLLMMREERADASGPISVSGLDRMVVAMRAGVHPTAEDLNELLDREDEDFVDCAYKTLLRRAPDSFGLSHYCDRLRAGDSKLSLIYDLVKSDEGVRTAAPLPGLRPALLAYRLTRLRFVGWAFAKVLNSETDHPQEARIRAIDRRLKAMAHDAERERFEADRSVAHVSNLLGALAPKRRP
jgi:hypothetical protein